ncbi:MAG: HIT domain-containing protein [Pseudohongiellaceae bacterium]
MSAFELDSRLAQDCYFVTDLKLSRLLLMNNQDYPWCILVPRLSGLREIHELTEIQQQQLLAESSRLATAMMELFQGEKMNVAALGNLVPQLHIHHIVRKHTDKAWPHPVWGFAQSSPYRADEAARIGSELQAALA